MRIVACIVVIALFLSLSFGCVGVRYTDTVQAIDITTSNKQDTSTRVLAKGEDWRNLL